jgi:ribosomal-protein-alanine N-acetyltransferase
MRGRSPVAASERVELHRPRSGDMAEFRAAASASRELHGRWLAAPTDREGYAAYLDRMRRPATIGFLVRRRDTGELAGFVNINDISSGALASCSLGYAAFVPHAGKGLLREGVALAVDHAFGPLGLHRVEANIQPGNERSASLVRGLGFRLEGYSRRFLYVDGDWRDHLRWAVVVDDWLSRNQAIRA